jgi:hypothetical protein
MLHIRKCIFVVVFPVTRTGIHIPIDAPVFLFEEWTFDIHFWSYHHVPSIVAIVGALDVLQLITQTDFLIVFVHTTCDKI